MLMDEDVTSVHITKGLTSSTILDLIEEYPNLEEITCCPSIFNRISKNYIDALDQLDITVSKSITGELNLNTLHWKRIY